MASIMHFLAERSDATHAEVVLDEAADEEVVEEGEPEHGALPIVAMLSATMKYDIAPPATPMLMLLLSVAPTKIPSQRKAR